jgi:predicted amidohydrolase
VVARGRKREGARHRDDLGRQPPVQLGEAQVVTDAHPELGAVGELYRRLAAEVVSVPSAFTLATTRDHWEILLRARAIENQCFVVAPNQIGEHPGGYRSGGRSMIVDPWGIVLACAPDAETAIVADLDQARLQDVRRRLPALAHRRPEVYANGGA